MGTEKVGVVADVDFIDILSLPLLALWDWHNICSLGFGERPITYLHPMAFLMLLVYFR